MTDQKSITLLNLLHPAVRLSALRAYEASVLETPANVHPVINETLRSFEKQGSLDSGVTKAKPGQSYHQYGMALDFYLLVDGKKYWPKTALEAKKNKNWMIVVNCFIDEGWESGLYWVGDFQDAPHLEKKEGFNWKNLLAFYKAGKFIPGEKYVDLI